MLGPQAPHLAPQLSEGAEAWLADRVHSGCALLHHKKGKGLQVDHHRKRQEAHQSLKPCQLAHPHVTLQQPGPQWAQPDTGASCGSVTPGNSQCGGPADDRTGREIICKLGYGAEGLTLHKLQHSSSSLKGTNGRKIKSK